MTVMGAEAGGRVALVGECWNSFREEFDGFARLVC